VAVLYVAHAVEIVRGYAPANLLWSCNVAVLAVALGLALERARVVGVGALLLLLGEPFWIVGIASGDFLVTSPLTHVVVPAVALWALKRSGVPRGLVLPSLGVVALATIAARVVAPPAENVNLASFVPPQAAPASVRAWLPHPLYLAGVFVALGAVGLGLEKLLIRALGPQPGDPKGP
jgi:hypothetical protein